MGEDDERFFRRLLHREKRLLVLTRHAQERAFERGLENRLIQSDLLQGRLASVLPRDSTSPGELVFDVRLIGRDGQPMRYVLAINNLIRVITLMKMSRILPGEPK